MATSCADSASGQPILPSSVPQIRPLDELGHDEAQAVRCPPHVMHRNDVGVVQPGEDAGLGQVGLRIGNSLRMRDLDGDAALQVFVIAQVHRGKTAAAKDSLNSVTPDPLGNGDLLKDRRLAVAPGRSSLWRSTVSSIPAQGTGSREARSRGDREENPLRRARK